MAVWLSGVTSDDPAAAEPICSLSLEREVLLLTSTVLLKAVLVSVEIVRQVQPDGNQQD